jgi:branched-chain amino acid transport system ATP-binding protein
VNLLETNGLTVTFGGLKANADVNITVPEGRFVGLIGPNGAGKTTFIDAITGFVTPSSGTVQFDGSTINTLSPQDRAKRGLTRTWQSLELFEDLTVTDNLLAAIEKPKWWSFLADMVYPKRSGGHMEDVNWALDLVGLSEYRDAFPSDLPHGQRKLVGVARALAARPRLILLDEPAAGLDTAESMLLGARLRSLLDSGMTVFMIDHDMGLVLSVCDEIYVLDFGRIIAHGTPEEIRTNKTVIEAYLGESASELETDSRASAMNGEVHQ